MEFTEKIEKQLRDNESLTQEILDKSEGKTFSSGREKQIGDYVLFGLVHKGPSEFELISFHQDELGTIYEEDKDYTDSPFLVVKKILS